MSPKLSKFFRKSAQTFIGILFLCAGLFVAISLISYNQFDPNANLSSNAVVKNWAGTAGAYIANPLLQFFGLGAIMLVAAPFLWGWKITFRKGLPKLWLKITSLIVAIPALSAIFALINNQITTPESWPTNSLGGYAGNFLNDKILLFTGEIIYYVAIIIITSITVFLALGMSSSSWLKILKIPTNIIFYIMSLTLKAKDKIEDITAGDAEEHEVEKKSQKKAKQKQAKADKKQAKENKKNTPKKEKSKKEKKSRRIIGGKAMGSIYGEDQATLDIEMRDNYQLPPLSLLKVPAKKGKTNVTDSSLSQNAELLEKVLEDFGVNGKIIEVQPGPVVTLYALEPAAGVKSSRVIGLADDIARSMSAVSARIAVIAGRNAIGIELPNATRETVYLKELLNSKDFKATKHKLPLALGKTISGEPLLIDLAKTPHLLVAGTTGSGKSVGINAMILSLLYKYSPDECKFIMIDPKMLELSVYQDIPHLITPVVTEPGKAVVALKWTVKEMENRYKLMSNLSVRNVEGYNKKIEEAVKNGEELTRSVQTGFDPESGKPIFEKVAMDMNPMPLIVVIVDEMADLMMVGGKDIEISVQRLAQMARAAGIHIILATQRPSVDVITGIIKANFPTRISFQVTSKIDSRTILGEQGAEQLLGMGDMLYMAGGSRITRVHGPFVDDKEVERIVSFLKKQGTPTYIEDVTVADDDGDATSDSGERDQLYEQAVAIVMQDGKASTSYVQRSLKIGYNRAANIIDQMEKDGVISPADHVGRREVLT